MRLRAYYLFGVEKSYFCRRKPTCSHRAGSSTLNRVKQSAPETALPAPISVQCDAGEPREFRTSFHIGRAANCELCISDAHVSRNHAEVCPENGSWVIRDLRSSNGLFLDGKRVTSAPLQAGTVIRLGIDGPQLRFQLPAPESVPAQAPPAGEDTIVSRYAERYFGGADLRDRAAGDHTMYIRRAFQKVQSRQRRYYVALLSTVLCAAGLTLGYALHLRREVARNRELARSLFYSMKTLDMEIAALRLSVGQTQNENAVQAINRYEQRRKQMEQTYDAFLVSAHVYKPGMTDRQRLIFSVARSLGECELDMPEDFSEEIERYIRGWISSGRFLRDIRTAQQQGYTQSIPRELEEHGLPPQFFYIAMQESDFNPQASGPSTRFGIAKGMWQLIPGTAVRYGLHLGPYTDLSRADPSDEREQAPKATRAAAEYLQNLYSTDAQASGLLVMACYNWGEYAVLPFVRKLPPNPRDRNFWKLLAAHRSEVPQQTYDYVLSITAAAVVGENPRLFGFDFDNPLRNQT